MSRSGTGRRHCCGRTWRQHTARVSAPRRKSSRGGLRWASAGIVIGHLTVSRVAAGLGVSWRTANTAILAEGRRRLIDDPVRFDGVAPRLLDMVEGRSKAVFKQWLAGRQQDWREKIEVVAMDGFTGFNTAAEERDF